MVWRKTSRGLAGVLLALLLGTGPVLAATDVADLAGTTSAARIALDHVTRAGAVEHAADGVAQVRYTFAPAPQPALVLAPARGSWDWTGQGELLLRVQNAMPWALTLDVVVTDARGGTLTATVGLSAGPAQTLVVPLAATSPRAAGMQVGPPMPFTPARGAPTFVATRVEGTLDLKAVRSVALRMPSPQAPQTLLLGFVRTLPGTADLHAAYAGIVDAFGQFTRAHWPSKVDTATALRAARARDAATLAAESHPAAADPYGGRATEAKLTRTGWFHVEKADGRWQLVTPDGNAFFSLGVNAVSADQGRSYVEGREYMFTGLPPAQGAFAAFYGEGDSRRGDQRAGQGMAYDHGRWFDFYAANLYRADGAHWLPAWRARSLARLRGWGFNTIGNWSDPALGQAHALPYTRSLEIAGTYGNVASGYDYWGRMPDPFDPRFVAAADAAAAKATAGVADDPWLIGYFADNELAWAGTGPQGRWGLALGTLAGEAVSPAKQAFIAMLRRKYVAPETLGSAWGIALGDWHALDATGFRAPVPNVAHPAIAEDYSAWLRLYADTYFRVVRDALRRHDAHHLFLGGRFAVRTPEAVAACAELCDVVSFNVYADLPRHGLDLATLHRLDKPVLISEFHFGSADRGPFGAGVVAVADEAARGVAYARFVQAAAADPVIVGAHWFEYADEPVTGRLLDGENSHVGLVGITDLPFAGFVSAVQAANRALRH